MSSTIKIETTVNNSIQKVWHAFNSKEHIVNWYFASSEWHCPKAGVDFKEGGNFSFTLAAKDGSMSFDFEGKYIEIEEYQYIQYELEDMRKVSVYFNKISEGIHITEEFEAEENNSYEMQKQGWQSILDNFKRYSETL